MGETQSTERGDEGIQEEEDFQQIASDGTSEPFVKDRASKKQKKKSSTKKKTKKDEDKDTTSKLDGIEEVPDGKTKKDSTRSRHGSTTTRPSKEDRRSRSMMVRTRSLNSKPNAVTKRARSMSNRARQKDAMTIDHEYEDVMKRNRMRKNFYYILSRTPSALSRRSQAQSSLEKLFGDVSLALVMIQQCSPLIYSSFSAWLKICPTDWLKSFLDRDGLSIMLTALTSSISRKKDFAEAIMDLMVIQCVKRVLNNETGMKYLIEGGRDLVRDFSCTMDTGNLMVKNQVLELWSGVCLYSPDGYELLLSTLDHFKVTF